MPAMRLVDDDVLDQRPRSRVVREVRGDQQVGGGHDLLAEHGDGEVTIALRDDRVEHLRRVRDRLGCAGFLR